MVAVAELQTVYDVTRLWSGFGCKWKVRKSGHAVVL
jgi:hypothetical protein